MAKARKRKRKWIWLRYRRHDLAHNVQCAVQRWIHANGGSAVLMGGVATIVLPGDPAHKYYVGISCLGRMPTKAEKSNHVQTEKPRRS